MPRTHKVVLALLASIALAGGSMVPLARAHGGPHGRSEDSAASPSLLANPPAVDARQCPNDLPLRPADRQAVIENAAFQATVYALPVVLQYKELYRQAVDQSNPAFTGFDKFYHERKVAGPDYATFKVPNADTLYSNAWLDLTKGPLEVRIPPTDLRYFTLNVFDIFGNPANLGTRTIGSAGARVLFVPPNWQGNPAPGVRLWRATSTHLWILMRVFAQREIDLAAAHRFQDGVIFSRPRPATTGDALQPPPPGAGASGMLGVLDYVLRSDGVPAGEAAMVAQFAPLGVLCGSGSPWANLTPEGQAAADAGYAKAMALIERSKSQLGTPTGTGWMKTDKGNYGFRYLHRAKVNAAGLGANVREENASFTTFLDGQGKPLDGAAASYRLTLTTRPPVNAFWSVTLYDAANYQLYPNPLKRYLIGDRTRGLIMDRSGSIPIVISNRQVSGANWLPAPASKFFVVIRTYLPQAPLLDGRWLPPPIVPVAPSAVTPQNREPAP